VYDVARNLAKMETREENVEPTLLCVHRRGSSCALRIMEPETEATRLRLRAGRER
jgi:hypothetical protein